MTDKEAGKVLVTFAKGLLDDVAELTTTTTEAIRSAKTKLRPEAPNRRVADRMQRQPVHRRADGRPAC